MLIPHLRFHRARHRHGQGKHPARPTLWHVSPGQDVTILGFEALPLDYQHYLQAYGVMPGRTVRVLAQRPVTIIQVEHTELAFEPQIARCILVGTAGEKAPTHTNESHSS
ncbi:MAG: ferrous iron transport protein A [Thermanaerothrix sp.]|nr:ferrous iron transport protein A [Thermanaerothrix sp.]